MQILYFLALIQVFLFFLFRSKKILVILISLNIGALFIIILFGYYPWVPKFWVPNPHGYPRVIPKKTQNFELYGYPTRKYPWNSDTNPTQPIPKIWFGSGYYPWVPMRIGYPKFGHPRVIPEINYGKKCSFSQKYKNH